MTTGTTGFYNKLADALFGSAQTTVNQPQGQYPDGIQNYLDNLENQPYYQKLLNQPKQTRLTPDQYKEGIAQGLNFGVPEIADAQDALKINKPQTGEEINLARQGQFNAYPIKTGLTTGPRQGGFINDLARGYKENYENSFDPNNLAPQKKNWATRIGEGLGSVGRFVDSPLGRGLIAYGLNEALGYDNSLLEGLTAFAGRQNAIDADRIYRQSLADSGIDLSGVRGNVTSDLYKNVSNNVYRQNSLQAKRDIAEAKDNVSRARMIMNALNNGTISPQEAQLQMANYGVTLNDVQESNNTRLLPYKQYAMQVAPQVALGNLGVAQGNLALRQAEMPLDIAYKQAQLNNIQNKSDTKLSASQKDALSTLSQINTIRQLVKSNPNATGLAQGYTPGDIINRVDKNPENIKTRTAIDALKTKVRHDLTGAQFSPKEAREYEKFLPTNKDNAKIIDAKLDALEQRYYADFGVSLTGQNHTNNNTIVTKLKNAGYSDEKIQQYLRQKGLQ